MHPPAYSRGMRFEKARRRLPDSPDKAHAWGCITVGLALLLGVVPLARTLDEHHTPWWQTPALVLGAVLLAVGLLIFLLPRLSIAEAPPATPDKPTGRNVHQIGGESEFEDSDFHNSSGDPSVVNDGGKMTHRRSRFWNHE